MIYNKGLHISKLHFAKKSTAGVTFIVMLVCVFCCFLGGFAGTSDGSMVYAANAYKPLDVEIAFECIENLRLPDGSYTISISAEDENSPLPENDTVEVKDGKGSFRLTVTEPGDYTYLVFQKRGNDENIIYDDTVYEIHISVMNKYADSEGEIQTSEDGQGELIYYMSVNYVNTDQKPEMIEFINESAGNDTTDTTDTTETTEITVTTESTENKKTTEKTETEETTEGTTEATTEPGDGVKTEDKTNIGLLFAIMGVSAGLIIILIVLKKRADKRREEEENDDDADEDEGTR